MDQVATEARTSTSEVDAEADADPLEATARELWGDAWRIVSHEWADGSVDRFAEHQCGIVERDERGPIRARERLFLSEDGEEYQVRRERVRKSVETVETTTSRRSRSESD